MEEGSVDGMTDMQVSFSLRAQGKEFPGTCRPTYEELERKVQELEKQVREGRQAQLELQESKERLNAVLDTIQAGIVVIDAQTRVIVGANAAAGRMMGISEHKMLGHTCHEYICPAKQGQCLVLDGGCKFHNTEQQLVTADGRRVPILKTAASIMLVGREHLLENFVDITDRKRAEEEREALITELKAALAQIKTLSGLLPICSSCKKIRDDKGYWNQIESYIRDHSDAEFSHSICPECSEKLYPGLLKKN